MVFLSENAVGHIECAAEEGGMTMQSHLSGGDARERTPQEGGSLMIQLLFAEPVVMPEQELLTEKLEQQMGKVECFCYEKKLAAFTVASCTERRIPMQLILTACSDHLSEGVTAALQEQKQKYPYQVTAMDVLAGELPLQERIQTELAFLDALTEIYPTCAAFYFPGSRGLVPAERIREKGASYPERFCECFIKLRLFQQEETGEALADTLGMGVFGLPELQYYFREGAAEPILAQMRQMVLQMVQEQTVFLDGDILTGVVKGADGAEWQMQWLCRESEALVPPARRVLDLCISEAEEPFQSLKSAL